MSGKVYFYNKDSKRYEPYTKHWFKKLRKSFFYIASVALLSAGISYVLFALYPSPNEYLLTRELKQIKFQYELLQDQLDIQEQVLANLRQRDAGVHRVLLGMEPIDDDVRNRGIGGSERFGHLKGLNYAGDIVRASAERIELLRRKIVAQSESLEEIVRTVEEREAMFASIPSIKPIRVDEMNRELRLMSGFGMRFHPIHKVLKMHTGLDFVAPIGTPIHVTGNGVVTRVARERTGYGRWVMVDHGFGYETLYAHMHDIHVRVGEEVTKGQIIGTVGNSGTSTSPHLHYEVRLNGRQVNPIHYCMDGLEPEEYAELVRLASEQNQSFD